MASFAQNPDAVYKLLRQEWTVNADGTSDYHYRHEVQILRNRALTAYADKGETFVVYNPDLEELTVNEVYTIQANGTRVDMPQNAFIYQLPSNCADCGRFNHLRELAMVHTGMELGCTIVVDYTLHRHYSLVNHTIELAKDCPVNRWEVRINVPEGHELNVDLNDPKVQDFSPSVQQTSNSYTMVASNVKPLFIDSYLPERDELYPTLHFYNGVPEFQPAFDGNGLREADNVANQLMPGSDIRENVNAVRNYVVDNIHLNDIDPIHLGYRHATAAEVWRTGCGTATDKAVLLAAMLNQLGYEARVSGDNSDEVGVMVDTLEYRLGVRNKAPMSLYGKAVDEVNTVRTDETPKATFDTLGDGFFRLKLAPVKGDPAMRASRLSLSRTAPLQSAQCDIESTARYQLPKGMKMVGNAVNESLAFDGIGSVQVSIRQKGKTIEVVRNLKLEQSVVPAVDFARFRQLLALWQSFDEVLLRNN